MDYVFNILYGANRVKNLNSERAGQLNLGFSYKTFNTISFYAQNKPM
jgi:hypothetical protein